MKRLILIVLALILAISVFAGCKNEPDKYVSVSSYMLGSPDRDDPTDQEIEEQLLASKALFAYKLGKTESRTLQTVYVWDNLLRRELRLDLMQLCEAVPDKDKEITISVSNEIRIAKKPIEFTPSSELSFAVLKTIFPLELQVNAQTLRQGLREMIIRLETVDYLGDTEVIAIQTITQNKSIPQYEEIWMEGELTEIMHLSEITGTSESAGTSRFPTEPPTLSVSDGFTTIKAWRGTYSWMVEDENGMGKGIQADSSHPLDCVDNIPAIEVTNDTTLTLAFETYPTSISIKRYKLHTEDHDAYEKVAAAHNMIKVEAGDYLYEVIAKWENPNKPYSGTVYFAFSTVRNIPDELKTENTSVLRLLRYTWDGWGISVKDITPGDVADAIIKALDTAKETGKTEQKISDDVIEVGGGDYPAERGTMWIEVDNKIYRLTPDLSQISLVETHFGKGQLLEMTDALKTDINNAWYYAPYDCYKGTYNSGDKTVELRNVFSSDSTVKMSIKNITVERNYDPKNKVTVELISTIDQEISVNLYCQQSDDNLAEGDAKTVNLKKDKPTAVELNFGGWPNFEYWVYIFAGNTKAEIAINP